ncbi:hypothetical protein T09_3196 [Trichinella sp. T9]|nr:hypothetical protein T09_3196 [Trichinella sp. T9]
MDVAFDASHNDSLVFVFLPHDVHAVHSSFTGIILQKRNPFSSGATYIKALRNCSSVSTAGLKSKVMVKTSGNCTIGFLHQKLEQSVKPKFASTGIFVQPIMPTFQVVIASNIYIKCIPKWQPFIAHSFLGGKLWQDHFYFSFCFIFCPVSKSPTKGNYGRIYLRQKHFDVAAYVVHATLCLRPDVIEPYVSRHLVKWAPQYCSRED